MNAPAWTRTCTEVDTGGERRAECRAAAGRRGRGGDRAAGTAPRGVRAPTLGQAAGGENNAAALEPFEQGAWLAAASAARGGAAGAKRRTLAPAKNTFGITQITITQITIN